MIMETEINVLLPYFITFAITAICFGIATWIANATLYRPDSSDIRIRKVWFWVMLVISIFVPLMINLGIAWGMETQHSSYTYFKHSCIADTLFAVVYIAVGLIVSKAFRTKKIGSWFK